MHQQAQGIPMVVGQLAACFVCSVAVFTFNGGVPFFRRTYVRTYDCTTAFVLESFGWLSEPCLIWFRSEESVKPARRPSRSTSVRMYVPT